MDTQTLVDKLKSAAGPDRVLDALLDIACDRGRPAWAQDTGTLTEDGDCVRLSPSGAGWHPPRYTASLDAASSLIPDGTFWMIARGRTRPDEPLGGASVMKPDDTINPIGEGEAETVPLAVCIAALEAHASLQPSQ